jgi:Cytochrome c3
VLRYLKIALAVVAVIVVAAAAAAGGGTFWLHDRLKTTEYCSTCHVIAPYYDSWKDSDFTAHAHEKAGIPCQACHTRSTGDGLRELFVNATRTQELPVRDHKVRAEECLRCHGSNEYLASLTTELIGPDGFALGRNPHDSHWGPLDCGICHKMHKPSVDFCSNCHGSPESDAGWVPPVSISHDPESLAP